MPGILMERAQETLSASGCPSTPRSQKSPQNESHNRSVSIEQLYDNVNEMASSSNGSPTKQCSVSDREESRIDSVLHHLVGGEMKAVEVLKKEDDIVEDDVTKREVYSSDKKSSKKLKSHSHGTKSSPSKKSNKPFLLQSEWDSSTRTSPRKNRTPEKGVQRERNPGLALKSVKKEKISTEKVARSENGTEEPLEAGMGNPDLGPFLLKHARDLISSGDNPSQALQYALRAAKSFEKCAGVKPSLDLVMCLHVVAAIHCNLGQYGEAIPVLERAIEIPVLGQNHEHALAKFSGYMQLGDTYAMLGQLDSSIQCYTSGLQVQKQALGDRDPRVGETCRYLAEAYVQALQFDEAVRLCQMALDIHREQGTPGSLEETADRRLLGLICDTMGNYETSLEHLVLASMAMMSNGQETEVASVDCSIGDTYLALARYDEAVFAYQKALTVFKSTKGENHPSVASVFVRLADLYNKTGKFRESKSYCENALRIYGKPHPSTSPEEIASGLADISAIYESMDDPEQALKLLEKALNIYNDVPGQQSTVAGIEAQMGVLYYITGNYEESYAFFKNGITKLRACGERKSAFFGFVLNQMGLACVQLYAVNEAADSFEEARSILEQEYGPYHPDTLGVYSNLAGTYDAMGRLDKAIEILEHVVGIREEKLGTANPEVDHEKGRLAQLLKEAGRARHRKTRSLEMLLSNNSHVGGIAV